MKKITEINTITDLTTIGTILKEFKADSVLLTQYTPTFRRVVLYLTKKDTTATLYLIIIGSKYIYKEISAGTILLLRLPIMK